MFPSPKNTAFTTYTFERLAKLKIYDLATYPFGSSMVSFSNTEFYYSYGMNTQEKDDEIYGVGNSYSAEYWQYDARLGRRWNVDPRPNPSVSVYACFGNNPLIFSDIYGDSTTSAPDGGKYVSTPIGSSILVGDGAVQSSSGKYLVYYSSRTVYKWDSEGNVYLSTKNPVNFISSGLYSTSSRRVDFNAFVTNLASVDNGFRHDSYNQNIGDELRFSMFEGYRTQRMGQFVDIAWNNPGTQGLLWITPGLGLAKLGFGLTTRLAGRGLSYSLAAKTSSRAFFSGAGTEARAIGEGFTTLSQTRAGQNLMKMTEGMPYYPAMNGQPASQAYLWWSRLSATYAKGIPKGSNVNVFLNKPSPLGIWNTVEKPILQQRGINIIYK